MIIIFCRYIAFITSHFTLFPFSLSVILVLFPNKYMEFLCSSSTSKKGSSSHMNRSASADSGSRQPWVSQGVSVGVMPNQPIVQDPSMPLMPPPNIRVQLDEVRRRLHEQDMMNTIPPKSKYDFLLIL